MGICFCICGTVVLVCIICSVDSLIDSKMRYQHDIEKIRILGGDIENERE